jgi:SAM-dependent methyltransferase
VTTAIETATEVTPNSILQIALGFMGAKQLFVASELDLFRQLAGGPLSLDEVMQRTGVPRHTARISLDAMVALDLVERCGDQYVNTAAAEAFLTGDGPADLRPLLKSLNRVSYPLWMHLDEAIRRGEGPNRQDGGFSDEDQRILSLGIGAFAAGAAEVLAIKCDLSKQRRILDLGGGTGSVLIPLLRRYVNLRATLFELPGVAALAREQLRLQREGGRVEVVEGDFLKDPLPGGHDAVILSNVVHLLSAARVQAFFRRVRQASAPGTRLIIVDMLTDPTHTQPAMAAVLAGEFLVVTGEGDVYSVDELREWLQQSGWKSLEHTRLMGPASLLLAEAA